MKLSTQLRHQKRLAEVQLESLKGKLSPERLLKLNQWLTQLRKQLRRAERKEAA